MSSADEGELMQRVRAGDKNAYRQLLDQQLPSVSRYVARMTDTSSEAEDITQEVFLRLWTHAEKYDPRVARLSTWLHNIAHNLCIDHFRKNGKFITEGGEDEIPGGSEPDNALHRAARDQMVKGALMTIPERQRSAIVMCHYQGLSNKEAASIMNISVDALESLLARGRRNLKSLLDLDE